MAPFIRLKIHISIHMKKLAYLFGVLMSVSAYACTSAGNNKKEAQVDSGRKDSMDLPAPTDSHTRFSKVIGWPEGKMPTAPAGFEVSRFAWNLSNPRWIYVGPNGDIFVAMANTEMKAKDKIAAIASGKAKSQNLGESANSVAIFRDADHDGKPEISQVFISGLNQPFGMLVLGNYFYVANTDGVWRYPYKQGDTKITTKGEKIVELPAGGYNNHWTRNLIASKDGKKIYISVGSGSNVAEHGIDNEIRRANILEVSTDGSAERVYASGLRNPVGMDWNPITGQLWTAVNERDGLGDALVPDYITSVKEGAFYGWPYAYFGQHEDPRLKGKNPEAVKKTIVPDYPLGSHTASLGLHFYKGNAFPEKYKGGAFVGQHGSWNHSDLVGYKVIFIPFSGGSPSGKQEDFLTGFIADKEKAEVYGRPVCIAELPDGALLVSDDVANTIWRIKAAGK